MPFFFSSRSFIDTILRFTSTSDFLTRQYNTEAKRNRLVLLDFFGVVLFFCALSSCRVVSCRAVSAVLALLHVPARHSRSRPVVVAVGQVTLLLLVSLWSVCGWFDIFAIFFLFGCKCRCRKEKEERQCDCARERRGGMRFLNNLELARRLRVYCALCGGFLRSDDVR